MIAIIPKIAAGQTASTLMGARTMALGNASASLADVWCGQNNPAGLGWLDGSWIAVANDRYPALFGANRAAATIGVAGKLGGISGGAYRFGDELYNEQILTISYGHKLGLASLGSRVDWIQYRAEGIEPVLAWGVTVGTRAQITDQLAVGGYATNINRPQFPDGRALPVRMAAGFSWNPAEKVLVCAELEKIADIEPTIKAGVELTPLKKVNFRTGVNLFPYAMFAGFGLRAWKVNIDYAMSFNHMLSYSHQVTLEISNKQVAK